MILKKRILSSLDDVKADDELKSNTLQYVLKNKEKKRSSLWKPISAVAVSAVCFFIFLYQQRVTPVSDVPSTMDTTEYSAISIDINPSFELHLNKENQVIDVVSFNDDATQILEGIDVYGKPYEEAINTVISSEEYQSYIKDDSFLQVSVYSSDVGRSKELEKVLQAYLSQTVSKGNYGCMSIDEATHNEAHAHHMSGGKYSVVEEIVILDSTQNIDELNAMTMAQLRVLYEELSGETYQGVSGHHGNGGGMNGNGPRDGSGMQHGKH